MNWEAKTFDAHDGGVNGLSWGPPSEPCLLTAENHDYLNS